MEFGRRRVRGEESNSAPFEKRNTKGCATQLAAPPAGRWSARRFAIKGVEQFAYLLGATLGHNDDLSKPATPNQFGKPRIDAKCPGRDSEIWTTERFLG